MHLFVCVDERDGLSFCGRRLSRDRRVTEHILRLTEGGNLWMSTYSAKLFPGSAICVAGDFQRKARAGDYCFVETTLLDTYDNLESVILYHWNRAYPATVHFPRKLLDGMKLAEVQEFPGSAHERITMERYTL